MFQMLVSAIMQQQHRHPNRRMQFIISSQSLTHRRCWSVREQQVVFSQIHSAKMRNGSGSCFGSCCWSWWASKRRLFRVLAEGYRSGLWSPFMIGRGITSPSSVSRWTTLSSSQRQQPNRGFNQVSSLRTSSPSSRRELYNLIERLI